MDRPCLPAVVSRQLSEKATIGIGAECGEQGLDPRVVALRFENAEIIRLLADGEEA
jgi:hypothetical protein